MPSLVWLITGCSSGFGSEIAKAALARGDRVVATARNPAKLSELKKLGVATLALDVCATDEVMQKTVADAVGIYGQIDVLINNAAYMLEGAVEECSQDEIVATFNTNVLGHLTVLRAVLPHMRARRTGTIANFGSIAGWQGIVNCGLYSATKFAMVGITEALRDEVAHLGIQVTIVEPGYFRTNFLSGGHRITARKHIADLDETVGPMRDMFAAVDRAQPGDPVKGARLVVEALTASGRCEGRGRLPLRFVLGRDAVGYVHEVQERNRRELDEWKELVSTTDCDDVAVAK